MKKLFVVLAFLCVVSYFFSGGSAETDSSSECPKHSEFLPPPVNIQGATPLVVNAISQFHALKPGT